MTHRDADACWPAGDYAFTETYYLDPADETRTEDGTPFDWGFTLVVRDDDSLALRG